MAHRKLQQEVDKVFKKINEGLEIFDTYYERHEACNNNPSQKDKLESDLKREVKKLQRLREQIKSWQSSPEIKDKDSLLNYRKSVEIAMEKYKIVEKASKEKAYSNISLKKSEILEPQEQERLEISNYLSQQIDELERQFDLLQLEIDKLFSLNKKKKTFSNLNDEKINDLKLLQIRYRWHQQQMELALRLLANEELDPENVKEIKDDINYFVESNQDDGFIEDESIYDNLNLQSNEAIAHEVSQSFALRNEEINNNNNNNNTTSNENEIDTSISTSISQDIDSSKLSKKELRRLEREAKKAAKLAAKNAAAQSLSEGPTISIKADPTPRGASPKRELSIESSQQSSPLSTAPIISNTSSKNIETPQTPTPNKITPNTITFKPVTIPARPAGDLKWSDAAALNMDTEKKSLPDGTIITPATINNNESKLFSNTNTPILNQPSLSSLSDKTKTNTFETLNQSQSMASATAAAVLAAGAAAVNQNNQQFHRNLTHPSSTNLNNLSGNDTINQLPTEEFSTISDNKNQTIEQKIVSNEQNSLQELSNQDIIKEQEELNLPVTPSMAYGDLENYDIDLSKNVLSLTDDQKFIKDKTLHALEDSYENAFDTLGLPDGIKEFIMGYEIYNNSLSPNDGKLGGYRRSVDLCCMDRLYKIPSGVNPPNPLDAFRSTNQWDVIRCGIDTTQEDISFDNITERFKGLEMFTLFYNYYFAITPLEKKIAMVVLRERGWKVAIGETMWFSREGETKFSNESFEIGDFKIFKLDTWTVIEKVNFKLEYSTLASEEIEDLKKGQNVSATTSVGVNHGNDAGVSHGHQLLQQLKLGKA
ncbi:similar to Saccharomyces cerevisiae YIL038C NOT3 Subunit of the CCR4-NOT complex [Maudiozyma saulgeensis]|uniref:General negative regulator of transcription subunit n=1 Tax=Maudiozyma saulgeensis TaxID=1789683 RepID=A0A1X7R8B7_9SACH|nr:similar to Saccharomyces cerevisiae YIL038C NOT3 Subunit of the CCR4-NOT complex [Kazachstania saulgeensis]